MSLARLSDDKNRDHSFSFKGLEDPYTGEQPTAYSRNTNLQPFLPNPSSDNLPKPVKTQLSVPIKKLYADAEHNQILKEYYQTCHLVHFYSRIPHHTQYHFSMSCILSNKFASRGLFKTATK